jgi:hypothetical protein
MKLLIQMAAPLSMQWAHPTICLGNPLTLIIKSMGQFMSHDGSNGSIIQGPAIDRIMAIHFLTSHIKFSHQDGRHNGLAAWILKGLSSNLSYLLCVAIAKCLITDSEWGIRMKFSIFRCYFQFINCMWDVSNLSMVYGLIWQPALQL